MSESSGRPTRRVDVRDGKPPTKIGSLVQRYESDAPPTPREETAPKVKTPSQPKSSDKDKWLRDLPQWVLDARPTTGGFYQLKWYLFARWVFANPAVRRNEGANVNVPKFVDYTKDFWSNYDFVRETCRETETTVVVVSASGGMGKTTVSSLLAAERKRATNMPVIAYDGDASDPNLMMWFDLAPEGILTANALAERLKESRATPHFTEFIKWCAVDRESGVQIVHIDKGKFLDATETKRNILSIKPSVHTLIGDTQPGTFAMEHEHATHAQIEVADIVIVAGDGVDPKGRVSVSSMLDYEPYRLRDENGRVDKRVLIVMSKVQPKDFNMRTRHQFAERYNAPVDQIVLIPTSKYLQGKKATNKNDKVSKIRIWSLEVRTRYAVSHLNRQVSELAMFLNRGRSLLPSSQPEAVQDQGLDSATNDDEHPPIVRPDYRRTPAEMERR